MCGGDDGLGGGEVKLKRVMFWRWGRLSTGVKLCTDLSE